MNEIKKEKKQNYTRDFKGVWIPKEIWLDTNLTWIEKLFLVEIDSLDNEVGCFASNKHFASFFNLSVTRCSQVINTLIQKGYVISEIVKVNNNVGDISTKRILNVNRLKEKFKTPLKKTKPPLKEKFKYNNIINNTNNIISSKDDIYETSIHRASEKMNKKIKQPIKKKLSYEDSKNITKNCIDLLFEKVKIIRPKTRNSTLYNPEEIYKAEQLINLFLKGFNLKTHGVLHAFVKEKKIPVDLNKGMTKKQFLELFDNSLKIYDKEYYPDNKYNTPNKLSDFLYNAFGSIVKSYFLLYGSVPPKKIKVYNVKDKYPELTGLYSKFFGKLTDKENAELNYAIGDIVQEYNRKINLTVNGVERWKLEYDNYKLNFNSVKALVKRHLEYLKEKCESDDKIYKNIKLVETGNGWWRSFILWVKERYEIDLYPTKTSMNNKYKKYEKVLQN